MFEKIPVVRARTHNLAGEIGLVAVLILAELVGHHIVIQIVLFVYPNILRIVVVVGVVSVLGLLVLLQILLCLVHDLV